MQETPVNASPVATPYSGPAFLATVAADVSRALAEDVGACDLTASLVDAGRTARARVLARTGMTPERFAAILARQLPDAEKRARANYVIDTGTSLAVTRKAVQDLVDKLRKQSPQPLPPAS